MTAIAAPSRQKRQSVTDYYIIIRLDGKPAMADAEAWIESHIRGPWRCRFLGYGEEKDELSFEKRSYIEVGFYFRRIEDLERFRVHFLRLKPKLKLRQKSNPRHRKSGFWAWLAR